jgi:hypothetical protein
VDVVDRTARAAIAARRRIACRIELTSAVLMAGLGALLAIERTLALTHG